MQIALTFILARTVARMVQFSSGLDSALSQSQVYTLVLDGALVLVATILLTVVPPGPSLGRAWGVTSPSTRKAHRHIAALEPISRSPGSPLLYLHGSPVPSPQYQNVRGYVPNSGTKEPRSPPPSVTTDSSATAIGSGYGYGHHIQYPNTVQAGDSGPGPSNLRRYSPSWMSHKRQPSAKTTTSAEPPPYERPASKYTQVPYIPPSLSQQYGHGNIVESQIVAPGSEGSRTGGSGGGGTTGHTGRTRRSPRAYEEDLVRRDAIW